MLSSLDADLVRRDPALPSLGLVLDPEALVDVLRRALPEADLSSARIMYVKYKPGMVCLVGYRLIVGGTDIDMYAKAYGANAPVKLQKAREKSSRPGALGPGRIPLEEEKIVVSVFPNDSKVRALSLVTEAEARLGLLQKLFPDRPTFWEGTLRGLVYKPERRFVAQLLTESGTQAVLKLYTQPGYDEVVQRHREPYEARPPLRLAARLGAYDRRAAMAFEWLPGRLLSEAILNPQFDAREVLTVGAALAQLHAQPHEGLPHVTPEIQANTVMAEARTIGLICPHLARQAEAVARQIAAQLIRRPPVYRLVHGDFHARQVLLNDETAAILDLDRTVYADPMIDLGLFAAHLEREVIRGNLPADRVEPLKQAFIAGYTEATHQPVAEADIQLYTAAELFRLAPRFFRYREPHWHERIEASLNRVETLLVQCKSLGVSLSSSAGR